MTKEPNKDNPIGSEGNFFSIIPDLIPTSDSKKGHNQNFDEYKPSFESAEIVNLDDVPDRVEVNKIVRNNIDNEAVSEEKHKRAVRDFRNQETAKTKEPAKAEAFIEKPEADIPEKEDVPEAVKAPETSKAIYAPVSPVADDDAAPAELPEVKEKQKAEESLNIEKREKPSASHDADDFIYTKYSGKKHKRGHISNHNTVSYSAKNNFVKDAHSRKRRRPVWQKLLIIASFVLAGLIVLGIIGVIVFFSLKNNGLNQLTNTEVNMTAPVIQNADVSVDSSSKTITYNGTTYVYNHNMTSILCMGIDKYELGLEEGVVGTGGQADALYLVAVDTATGKTDIIGISRDIYSDIDVYSADGEYVGVKNAQLCLSFAYGNGKHKSAENTTKAVSRMMYNLPINSYFAIKLSAIAHLNDAVGGVSVTLEDDYLYHYMQMGMAGDTILLEGDQARAFLQYRNVDKLESSLDRMNRQLHYLERFSQKAIKMTKKDITTPVTLFNIVQDYSVTNLTASKVAALGYTVATSATEPGYSKVPGEVIHNGEYAEFIVDEQGLLELILDIYYTPVI